MEKKKWGVVIPASEDRLYNLKEVISHLDHQTEVPDQVVIVCDGWSSTKGIETSLKNIGVINTEKYVPDGKHEQPRNAGVRALDDDIDYVWFLDSDCIPSTHTLEEYKKAMANEPRILIGPYDWLPEGRRTIDKELHNDPRWEMFKKYLPSAIAYEQLNYALACFSGNLVWPVDKFKEVGGFWNEINMGRCEDGELGLRASSLGIPMSVVKTARAWHLWHPVNMEWITKANARDVPLLNKRHPWVEEKGIVVADKDGKRFDIVCPVCGKQINTNEIWEHPCQIH